MAEKYPVVATGGTFDEIHVGHMALLARAFQIGEKVIIGVSSDEFAIKRGKKLNHNFGERVENLKRAIRREFGSAKFEIAKLDADFGPAVTSGEVAALVASAETQSKGRVLNEMRANRGLKPVRVIAVKLVRAEDGSPISSTRIRKGEMDSKGRLLKIKEGGARQSRRV
ncbi:MAG: phosphopantetheine adenylyltransferase [Nitrososphaera sp.]